MKPIRTERTERVDRGPWSGNEHTAQQQDTAHRLDADGAIDSHTVERRIAASCGCLAPPVGFCGECERTVCANCYARCLCGKPLCPRHTQVVSNADGAALRLCPACGDAYRRASATRRVVRSLLSFFVDFDGGDGRRHRKSSS